MKQLLEALKSLNNHAVRTQIAIALVCALIGLLIVTQLRVQQSGAQALQAATESDLGEILSNLNNEINTLKAETMGLKLQLYQIEKVNNDSSAIMRESEKNLNNLKIIAGLSKVTGPGINVQITDENRAINANDLVDIITEIRVGGAEAISLNGIRVVSSTGIIINERGIFVNGRMVSPPYEVLAVGDPDVLQESLAIAGGIKDKLSSLSGVTFNIFKNENININAVVTAK